MFTHLNYSKMFKYLISFFYSFLFFSRFFFLKRYYDVVFYFPQHFNRLNNGSNQFIEPLVNSCIDNKISYIIFEEPDWQTNYPRNEKSIPFDFIYVIVLILRKIIPVKDNFQYRENKIGKILSLLLFNNFSFSNYIVLSQSMLGVFKGLNYEAKLFDLQHGILHNQKNNYLIDGKISDSILLNNVNLLLTGFAYKNILINHENGQYFKSNSFVIGSEMDICIRHTYFNNNILVTLQLTRDHTYKENILFLNELYEFITSNSKYIFYLKHHPRFNDEVNLDKVLSLNNVQLINNNLNDCFSKCSIHLTAYSTTTFEAALIGIPTIFLNKSIGYDYFENIFQYPFNLTLNEYENVKNYKKSSDIIQKWAKEYYNCFDKNKFIKLLK